MTTAAGTNTVVEAASSGTRVAAIKSNHTINKDLATGTITVNVVAGSTPANETLVTYQNATLPVLGLKICKAAADTSLQGSLFSFTENGGPAFSVLAGTLAAPNCGPITRYANATNVNVAELPTPNVHASSIAVSDNRGSNVNLSAGTVTATVGSGVTEVTYTNAANPISQIGYIGVCKQPEKGDPYVKGTFAFTVTAPGITSNENVIAGQCTAPIAVPAGNVSVTEASLFPYLASDIEVAPKSRLVSSNLVAQTVTVTVPVGPTNTETLATFENATRTGQVSVCKALTAGSGALTGMTFNFIVTSAAGQDPLSVIAGAPGSSSCVIDPRPLPLGTAVSIVEQSNDPAIQVVAVSVAPASQDNGSSPPTANLTVGSGVTTATFTNEAFGTLEVCKQAADPSTATQSFQFSVNGATAISVPAGQCSFPLMVPAGTATIAELASSNFHLVSVTALGPTGDNRLLSGSSANPATASVLYGGVASETVATFTNAVNTGQFKICKVSTDPALQGVTFGFSYSYIVNGATVTGTTAIMPGQCSGLSSAIPVVDANGNPIPIDVSENPDPAVKVSKIAVSGAGTLIGHNPNRGTAIVAVGRGVTMVTYENVRTPASVTVVKSEPSPGAGIPVTAGQAPAITYQLAAVNGGGTDAGAVTVTDDVPAGTSYVAGSAICPPATSSCSVTVTATTVTWTLMSVPALSTLNLSFQVTVDTADANRSSISNRASYTNVRTPGCGQAGWCQTNAISNPVVTPASISVVKSEASPGSGATLTAGQIAPVTYYLAVANSGGSDAGPVTVTDPIPAGTSYVAGSARCPRTARSCSVAATAMTITWTLTAVPALATVRYLSFQVTVDAGDANGSTIANQATYTNVNTPGCSNSICDTNTVANPVVTLATIDVFSSEPGPGSGTTVVPGQVTPITYQLAVVNSGGTDAGLVTVKDRVPIGASYVAGSAACPPATPSCSVALTVNAITWTLSSMPALATANLSFQVSVDAADVNGSAITNQATFITHDAAGCTQKSPCPTGIVTNPVVTPASITVVQSEPTPGPGGTVISGQVDPITYQLAVINSGGSDAGPVSVTDAVPAGTTYNLGSATCPPATTSCTVTDSATTVTWTLTTVPALSTVNLSFPVSVSAADPNDSVITNQGGYTAADAPGCASSPCATNTITNPVITPASITVTKSEGGAGPGSVVTSGQAAPINYQLAVVNSGGNQSTPVTVTDDVPAGTSYIAGSATCPLSAPSCSVVATAATITWTIMTVPGQSTVHLSFRVSVAASDTNGSTIVNQASYISDDAPGCAATPCPTDMVVNPVVTPASVTVVKSEPSPGAGTTVTAGQAAAITYQLAVTNGGGTDARAVTVIDTVPAGASYLTGSAVCPPTAASCSVAVTGPTITWTLTSVPALTSVDLSSQVSVDAADTNGSSISNQAGFITQEVPGCTRHAPCLTNTMLNPVVTPASVTVIKSEPSPGAGTTVSAGQAASIIYQLAVTNSGGSDAGPVTVTDNIPAGTTYLPGSAACPPPTAGCTVNDTTSTITWTMTSVSALSTIDLSFEVNIDAGDIVGSIITNQGGYTSNDASGCSGSPCGTNTVDNPVGP